MGTIIVGHDDIQIKIKGESEHFLGQDLYTRAVTSLICEADVHGWHKDSLERGDSSEALFDFCASVLASVIRLWVDEASEFLAEQTNKPLS